ncbi:MAG TPA: hypothetical protein VII47_03045 [Actinomycetota bacterium]
MFWAVVLALAIALPAALAAQPQEPESKFRSGSEIVIEAGETVPHDLYLAGSTIRVEGKIDGDLLVAGGQIVIDGPVTGDLWAAGRSITVRSDVGGDARLAGSDVRVEGKVGEDLLAGAGNLTLSGTGSVGGDLVFGTQETRLDGTVAGGVLGSTGVYERRGSVGGPEHVKVEKGRQRAEAAPTIGSRLLDTARRYVSILLVGALLLWVAPSLIASGVRTIRQRPLPSLGAGILGVAGFVVAIVALFLATGLLAVVFGLLTLGGLVAATVVSGALGAFVLFLAFSLTVFFVAHALAGIVLGRLALRRGGEPSRSADLAALAIGAAILAVLWAIPVLGELVRLVTALGGLGALVLLLRRARRAEAPTPSPVAAPPA